MRPTGIVLHSRIQVYWLLKPIRVSNQRLEKELHMKTMEFENFKEEYESNKKNLHQKEKEYENNLFANSQNYISKPLDRGTSLKSIYTFSVLFLIAEIGQLKTEIELYKKRVSDIETDR